MAPKRKKQSKPNEIYTSLTIRVESHDAEVGASINHSVRSPEHAWRLDDNDPVYRYTVRLTINGVATYPENRVGDVYEFTVYGEDAPSLSHNLRLKDVQEREEEYNTPKYREYRGKRVPIYIAPKGLGHLQKVRGEKRWTAWLFTPARFVSDLLLLLGQDRPLFLSLRERKEGRDYWIQDISLQTNDPTDE